MGPTQRLHGLVFENRALAFRAGTALVLLIMVWLAVADARRDRVATEHIIRVHAALSAVDRLTLTLLYADTDRLVALPGEHEATLAVSRTLVQQITQAFAQLSPATPGDVVLLRDAEALATLAQTLLADLAHAAEARTACEPPCTPAPAPDGASRAHLDGLRTAGARLHAHGVVELQRELADARERHRRTERRALLLVGVVFASALLAFRTSRRQACARRLLLQRLEHEATHDALTQLPNRRFFLNWATYGLAQARRSRRSPGVLLLDLDGFKAVNDHYGHAAGDRLLVEIAGRLQRCLREADVLARLGGDEFVILAMTAETTEELVRLASRLLLAIQMSPLNAAGSLRVGLSIGIARLFAHGDDILELLQAADAAMYAAKRAGGQTYRIAPDRQDRQDLQAAS